MSGIDYKGLAKACEPNAGCYFQWQGLKLDSKRGYPPPFWLPFWLMWFFKLQKCFDPLSTNPPLNYELAKDTTVIQKFVWDLMQMDITIKWLALKVVKALP